jgi:hypothetical protein
LHHFLHAFAFFFGFIVVIFELITTLMNKMELKTRPKEDIRWGGR